MRKRVWPRLAIVLVTGLLTGFWSADKEREQAGNFMLEKLRQTRDHAWHRLGAHFFWSYDIEQGCRLRVLREDKEGGHRLVQQIPVGDTWAQYDGRDQLLIQCRTANACISYRQLADSTVREGELRRSELPLPRRSDGPKLQDAWMELNRLCDDRYRPD